MKRLTFTCAAFITLCATAAAPIAIAAQGHAALHQRQAQVLAMMPVVRAQHEACSLASLRGAYAVYGQGNVFLGTPQAAQEVDVGLINYDGNGNFTGSSTFSLNGRTIQTVYSGMYAVNEDCSTTATLTDSLGEHLHEAGVILGGGDKVRFIETDPGAVIARVAERLR